MEIRFSSMTFFPQSRAFRFISSAVILAAGILILILWLGGIGPASDSRRDLIKNRAPEKKSGIGPPVVGADAYFLELLDPAGEREILLSRNATTSLPIASITKLVTALAVERLLAPEKTIAISDEVLGDKGDSGRFDGGEEYRVNDLMAALLIESNNDAAEAFASAAGVGILVREMNRISSDIGLTHTAFVSPSGLDGPSLNRSSAEDVARVLESVIARHPAIARMIATPEMSICTSNGEYCYLATTTNALLLDPAFPLKIIGGKTGETPRAGKNLVLAAHASTKGWMLIGVVLGSRDHFADMKKIFEWAKESYVWP